jgi:CBS domain-containing protein
MWNQRVADVMTTDVVTVGMEAGFKEIVRVMSEHGVTAVPVVDGTGHVKGIVTETDLLRKIEYSTSGEFVPLFERAERRHARHKSEAVTAAHLMTTPAVTISPDTKLVSAAQLLSRRKLRRIPVTDAYGALVGIVSRGDLISVYTRPDAEIAADVQDQVLRRALSIDPDSMQLQVIDGVVDIGGGLERRSLVPLLIELIRAVDGVVDVQPHLTYVADDTIPSTFIGA